MSLSIQVRLLGGFDFIYGAKPVSGLNTPRLQSLISFLLLHRQSSVSRQQLAYLFWPDSTDAQARTNLRHLLHSLRKSLPDSDQFIKADQHTLLWQGDSHLDLDVQSFEKLANQIDSASALQDAIDLYSGDLLPDIYDDWVIPERKRLRELYLSSLERLTILLETERKYTAAIQSALQLLEQDPMRESNYRRLMRLHVLKDDRAGALRIFHACVATLQRELDVEPSQETKRAYRRLLNLQDQSEPVKPVGYKAAPLVGRYEEWGLLQNLWKQTKPGHPHMALVAGEAGIGKTRLAEELLRWTSRQGIYTAEAHCFAAQDELAFAPLSAWLRQGSMPELDPVWLVELSRLLPELKIDNPSVPEPEPMRENWQRLRLFEALAHAFLDGRRTVLLFLDDLQWCDRDSLDWLHYLLNLPSYQPSLVAKHKVVLLGTLRSEEESANPRFAELLISLRGTNDLTEIHLSPLDEDETSVLASHLAGEPLAPGDATRLYQDTEGNPLFVVEMIRAGLSEDTPPRVQAVIATRLAKVSSSARQLADLAAVIGRQFTFPVLIEASDHSESTLVKALDELWQRRIIRERGAEDYDFSHDKIREVVYTALSTAQRRWLHKRAAQSLEAVYQTSLDAVSGQIARHFEFTGLTEQALDYYLRAADVARKVYANPDAIAYYNRALNLLDTGKSVDRHSDKKVYIYENLGDVLSLIGKYDQARQNYHAARDHMRESGLIKTASLERKIANCYRDEYSYEFAEKGYQLATSVLEKYQHNEEQLWWQEWIQIQLDRLLSYYWIGDIKQSALIIKQVENIIEKFGSTRQQSNFHTSVRRWLFRRDLLISEEALEHDRRALALLEPSGQVSEIASLRFGLGFSLLWHRDFDEAEHHLKNCLSKAESTGDRTLQTRCLAYLTILYRMQGRTECVREYADRTLAAAQATGMPEYDFVAIANQAWLSWMEKDFDTAVRLSNQSLQILSEKAKVDYPIEWLARFSLIDVYVRNRQYADAIEHSKAIISPRQIRLPSPLQEALQRAGTEWDEASPDSAPESLLLGLEVADDMGYL